MRTNIDSLEIPEMMNISGSQFCHPYSDSNTRQKFGDSIRFFV